MILAAGLLGTGGTGCRLVQATADLPGNAVRAVTPGGGETEKPPDPVLLQQDLFRFADELSVRVNQAVLQVASEDPHFRSEIEILEFRLAFRNRLLEVVTGPNAFINLVDTVFLVVIFDDAVNNYYAPALWENRRHPALDILDSAREEILQIAESYLGPEQQERLLAIIGEWLEKNFKPAEALYTRYRGLTEDLLASQPKDESKPTSLFGALMLDPLAGLDPTVREIAQARLFAERAMFIAQRMPPILRLQSELFAMKILDRPESRQILEETATATRALEQVSKVAAELPDRITAEREAIVQTFTEQNEKLTELVKQSDAALATAGEAITQANTLVDSVDSLLDSLGVYEPPDPDGPPGEPFRIEDYTTAIRELQAAAERINTLANTLNSTLATATSDEVAGKIQAASESAVASGEALVDYAFRRLLLLFAACAGIVFAVAIALRLIPKRGR